MEKIAAIVLAAGKGTRMNSKDTNKVALSVDNKPLILRTLDILKDSGIKEIIVVVGFAKESVIKLLDSDIKIAVQAELLGTGDAERTGLKKVSANADNVLSVSGDDSFLYTPEIINQMVSVHEDTNAQMTFITVNLDNPTGYGRIVRDENGKIVKIVEELNAIEEERKIKEINTGCYLFNKKTLRENIDKIKINNVKGEFYLTDILEIFLASKYTISSINIPSSNWRGINTPEELKLAEEALKENG